MNLINKKKINSEFTADKNKLIKENIYCLVVASYIYLLIFVLLMVHGALVNTYKC